MSLEKYRDYVGIENMGYLYHEGVLAHYQSQLVEQVKEMDEYEKNTVYDSLVFETHLMHVKQVDFLDELTSTIERCIEYGFFQQLELVLEQLDRLVLMANHTDGVTMLDRRLLLRKLEMKCYCLAKSHGFIDAELEKRVTIFQRVIRSQPVETQLTLYTGPTPEEYFNQGTYVKSSRYWGYRQTLYYLRWNPSHRYHILWLMMHYWRGDCRYQAYIYLLGRDAFIDWIDETHWTLSSK